jgi:hypothetical protein
MEKRKWKSKGIMDISPFLCILNNLDSWRSRFAKRFPKRLQLHQRSRSTNGAEAEAVFGGAGTLPNLSIYLYYKEPKQLKLACI